MNQKTIIKNIIKERKKVELNALYSAVEHFPNPSIRRVCQQLVSEGEIKRVIKGVYAYVGSKNTLSLIIDGSGRQMDAIEDGSIDGALITDHPWLDPKSHKGGNRKFVSYESFQYVQKDFDEKFRVLKEGRFLIEILPAQNENNKEYLRDIELMAEKSGFKFYDIIPFFKDGKVSNTGRKISGQYNLLIYSKGKARNLRPNMKEVKKIYNLYETKMKTKDEVLLELFGRTSKKDMTDNFKSYTKFSDFIRKCIKYEIYIKENYCMSGTNAILPMYMKEVMGNSLHQAEKPINLYAQLIKLFTRPGEIILDQFSGSFNIEDAARKLGRHFVGFEIDNELVKNKAGRVGFELVIPDQVEFSQLAM